LFAPEDDNEEETQMKMEDEVCGHKILLHLKIINANIESHLEMSGFMSM